MDIRRFAQQVCRNAITKESHTVDINMVATTKIVGNNKRKRRSTVDEKDNDYEHEAKRRNTASCGSHHSYKPKTEITSSSEESSPQLTYATLSQRTRITRNSPAHLVSNVADADSPIRVVLDELAAGHHRESWHTRGDVTPHSKDSCRRNLQTMSPETDSKSCIKSMSGLRPCPLPALSWANASEVWKVMCEKDEACSLKRSANMLENHAELQPRMRAILLDWLIEVCEVYKLHRETYYLAVDYLDRYISNNKKIQKTHLQLIGITCLFVAAKVEEIYPPKIGEFAYVTDGACQEEDILQQELLLLKTLDWSISPVTVLGWLGVYMQLNVSSRTPASFVNSEVKKDTQTTVNNSVCVHKLKSKVFANEDCGVCCTSSSSNHNNNNSKSPRSRNSCKRKLDSSSCSVSSECSDEKITRTDNSESASSSSSSIDSCDIDDAFIYPQFSGMEFVQTAQLLDLCSLDLGIASFPYSVIAAAAISHTFTRDIATRVSGLDWSVIAPCAQWMIPFFESTSEASQHLYLLESNEQVKSKFGLGHFCPNIVTDDSHIIQTHTTSIEMFDKACLRREHLLTTLVHSESSPALPPQCPEGLLTPPLSSRKSLDVESEPEINN